MPSLLERVDELVDALESLPLDSWGEHYFDNYELQQRAIGRLGLLRTLISILPDAIVISALTDASIDYMRIRERTDPFDYDFHNPTPEED